MSSRVRRQRTSGVRCVSGGPGVLPGLLAERLDVPRIVFAGDLQAAPAGGPGRSAANASLAGSTWVHVAHEPSDGLLSASDRVPAAAAMVAAVRSARGAGVERLVVVSSAMAHGALPGRVGLIDEAAPLSHVRDGSVADVLLDVEQIADASREGAFAVVMLRPTVLVGPGIDSPFTRQLHALGVLSVRGEPLRWQLCHVDDLVAAVRVAAQGALDELQSATVTPPGWLDAGDLASLTRRRRVELPASVLFGAAERLQKVGVAAESLGALRFVVHPWAVDARRLMAAGWQPAVSHQEAVVQVLSDEGSVPSRGPGRREAWGAAGAAGVTVAALGTAALVRRARKHPGR